MTSSESQPLSDDLAKVAEVKSLICTAQAREAVDALVLYRAIHGQTAAVDVACDAIVQTCAWLVFHATGDEVSRANYALGTFILSANDMTHDTP